jgi:hypothetical protein
VSNAFSITWINAVIAKPALLDDIAATGHGLTLGIQSRIDATVGRIVERLSTGNIDVNRNITACFGRLCPLYINHVSHHQFVSRSRRPAASGEPRSEAFLYQTRASSRSESFGSN